MRDQHIVDFVVNSGGRPRIPPNCPPNFLKCLSKLWDKDPGNRPSFTEIIEMIITGDLSFPGTDLSHVQNYIKFNMPSEHVEEKSDVQNPEKIQHLIQHLNESQTVESDLKVLLSLTEDENFKPFVLNESCVPYFVALSKTGGFCPTSLLIIQLIYQAYLFNPNSFTQETFNEVFRLFSLDDSSTAKEFILLIFNFFQVLGIFKLPTEDGSQFVPYLKSSNLEIIEMSSSIVLNLILEKKISDFNFIKNIASCVIENVSLGQKHSILEISVKILNILVPDKQLCAHLALNSQNFKTLLDLIIEGDVSFLLDIFPVLTKLNSEVSNKPESKKIIEIYLNSFSSVTKIKNQDVLLQFLTSFGFLNHNSNLIALIEAENPLIVSRNLNSLFYSFDLLFSVTSDPRVHFLTLRLIYSFLTQPKLTQKFISFLPIISKILAGYISVSNPVPVLTMASSCILLLFPYAQNDDDILNEFISLFLKNALQNENQLSIMGLRLFGVISSTVKGCLFLDSNGLVSPLTSFLVSKFDLIRNLTISCFAEFSSNYTLHKTLLEIVPTFIQFAKTYSGEPLEHSLFFLTNLAPHPSAASLISRELSGIIKIVKDENDKVSKFALEVVNRTLSSPEGVQSLQIGNEVPAFFALAEKILGQRIISSYLTAIDLFSATQLGRQALLESTLPVILARSMSILPNTDLNKPILLRIVARSNII